MRYLILWICLVIGLALLVGLYFLSERSFSTKKQETLTQMLDEAYRHYQQGEQAPNLAMRKEAFNKALQLYTQLEQEGVSQFSTGKLQYAMGNTYFQLEQYPWAILYYNRALHLMPRGEEAQYNLKIALQKAGLPVEDREDLANYALAFHRQLSLSERLTLFFFFSLGLLFIVSVDIWYPRRWLRPLIYVGLFVWFIFLGSVLYSRYVAPLEAVFVQASLLYRDAGEQYSPVNDRPLPGGVKVEVLDVVHEGRWLKVQTPDGVIGFVPADAIRIV
jgi:tetratricopeptide (TPR) repeat protein